MKFNGRLILLSLALLGPGLAGSVPGNQIIRAAHAAGNADGTASVHVKNVLDLITPGIPTAVAWSPDGGLLVAASNYGQDITVWDRAGRVKSHFKREGGGPFTGNSLAFVHGSSALLFPPPATSDNNASFDVWNVATGRIEKVVPGPLPGQNYARNRANHFVVSPDQKFVAASPNIGGIVSIYEVDNWRLVATTPIAGSVSSLCFFPDGKRLAVGALINGHWSVLDTRSGRVLRDFAPYESKFAITDIGAIAVSPDGSAVLTGVGAANIKGDFINSPAAGAWVRSIAPVAVWRADEGALRSSFSAAQPPIRQAVWDPLGRYVAFVDTGGSLFFWQPSASNATAQKIQLVSPTMSIAVTPDGDRMAVASGKGVVVIAVN